MAWPDEGINVYTWANKPLATDYTGRAFISDIGGGSIWISNGTRWYPQNGRITLFNLGPNIANVYATETVLTSAQFIMPADLLLVGDQLRFTITVGKSSTVEAGTFKIYIGATGTIGSDVNIANVNNANFMTGNVQSFGGEIEYHRETSTQLRKLGNNQTKHGFGGAGDAASAVGGLTGAITGLTGSPMYITPTLLSSAGAETYTVYQYRVEYISVV